MRILLICLCLLPLNAVAQRPGQISSGDMGSGRVIDISGRGSDIENLSIANGDLGSGRSVRGFLISPQQLTLILRHPEAAGAIVRSGANHIGAARGYSLRGTPVREGVADCTQTTTACYVVSDEPDGLIIIINRGEAQR